MRAHTSFGPGPITGGCGFYGRHLIRRILDREPACAIAVLDVGVTQQPFLPSVSYHERDISDGARVRAVFERELQRRPPRVVFHPACPPSTVRNDVRFRRVNVEGTWHVLECSRLLGARAFVHT